MAVTYISFFSQLDLKCHRDLMQIRGESDISMQKTSAKKLVRRTIDDDL